MRKHLLLLTFLVVITQFCYSQNDSVQVTYIANAGFLIEVNNKKILIDALLEKHEPQYCVIPTDNLLKNMKSAADEFSDINIIVSTHHHPDHFCKAVVMSHLLNNPKGVYISTKQTIDELKSDSINFSKIKKQVNEITPEKYKSTDIEIDDVKIEILRFKHRPTYTINYETGKKYNEQKNIQNIGFIFEIDGVRIFYCGDAITHVSKEYEIFAKHFHDIDIAFLDRYFFWSDDGPGYEIIHNYIKPKHVVIMHVFPDNYELMEVAKQESENELYTITLFKKQGDKKMFQVN